MTSPTTAKANSTPSNTLPSFTEIIGGGSGFLGIPLRTGSPGVVAPISDLLEQGLHLLVEAAALELETAATGARMVAANSMTWSDPSGPLEFDRFR